MSATIRKKRTEYDTGTDTYWITFFYSDGTTDRRKATEEEIAKYKGCFKALETQDWGFPDQ